jgi:hypothetical protein
MIYRDLRLMRLVTTILGSSLVGAAVSASLAGWIYPCLGAARWERCASGTESDPATFALPLCHLGVCDTYLSGLDVVSRLVVVAVLVSATGAAAWYFSPSRRALAAGLAVTLAALFFAVMLPYAYPHGWGS